MGNGLRSSGKTSIYFYFWYFTFGGGGGGGVGLKAKTGGGGGGIIPVNAMIAGSGGGGGGVGLKARTGGGGGGGGKADFFVCANVADDNNKRPTNKLRLISFIIIFLL